MTPRMQQLMVAAHDALEDGDDPFATPFLTEHDVTLDECMDMAAAIQLSILAYLGLAADGVGPQLASALGTGLFRAGVIRKEM